MCQLLNVTLIQMYNIYYSCPKMTLVIKKTFAISIFLFFLPILEEYIFRYLSMEYFNIGKNDKMYQFIVSIVFGFLHITNYSQLNSKILTFLQIVMTTILSLIIFDNIFDQPIDKINMLNNAINIHVVYNVVGIISHHILNYVRCVFDKDYTKSDDVGHIIHIGNNGNNNNYITYHIQLHKLAKSKSENSLNVCDRCQAETNYKPCKLKSDYIRQLHDYNLGRRGRIKLDKNNLI